MTAHAPVSTPTLRPAGPADRAFLFALANDPVTRRMARATDPIAWATHCAWFERRLARPETTRILIAERAGQPVGQLRLDRAERGAVEAEIDFAVAPAVRGQGIGGWLLARAVAGDPVWRDVTRLTAEVRRENAASAAAFRSAGFQEVGGDGPAAEYRRFECAVVGTDSVGGGEDEQG